MNTPPGRERNKRPCRGARAAGSDRSRSRSPSGPDSHDLTRRQEDEHVMHELAAFRRSQALRAHQRAGDDPGFDIGVAIGRQGPVGAHSGQGLPQEGERRRRVRMRRLQASEGIGNFGDADAAVEQRPRRRPAAGRRATACPCRRPDRRRCRAGTGPTTAGTTSSGTTVSPSRRRSGFSRLSGLTRRSGVARSKADVKIRFQPTALAHQPLAEIVARGERGQGELHEPRVGGDAGSLFCRGNQPLVQPGAQEMGFLALEEAVGTGGLEREPRLCRHQRLRTPRRFRGSAPDAGRSAALPRCLHTDLSCPTK